MTIIKELLTCFNDLQRGGTVALQNVTADSPAWAVRVDNMFGVAVAYAGAPVDEKTMGARMCTKVLMIEGKKKQCLLLVSLLEHNKDDFATHCADFIASDVREELLLDPFRWWTKHRVELSANVSLKKAEDVLAEMITIFYLKLRGYAPQWTGPVGSVYDIADANGKSLVKAVGNDADRVVVLPREFMKQDGNLFVYLCGLKKADTGVSINRMVDKLAAAGFNKASINGALHKLGYGADSKLRKDSYLLKEFLIYNARGIGAASVINKSSEEFTVDFAKIRGNSVNTLFIGKGRG